jgi:hypothetical protein
MLDRILNFFKDKDIEEIKDVLTREGTTTAHVPNGLGSELDGKVEQTEFDEFKKKIFKKEDESSSYGFRFFSMGGYFSTQTLEERIENIEEKLLHLTEYLGVERVTESEKTRFIKVKKSKKGKR